MRLTKFPLAALLCGTTLLMLNACAAPSPTSAPATVSHESMPPGMVAYGQNVIQIIGSDQLLTQILTSNGVTKTFGVGLIIDPNGYVEKGFMTKSELPEPIAQQVINHLINVNFGSFSPDMPNHKLVFVVPVHPPAAS